MGQWESQALKLQVFRKLKNGILAKDEFSSSFVDTQKRIPENTFNKIVSYCHLKLRETKIAEPVISSVLPHDNHRKNSFTFATVCDS